ncbi:hypothetical protein ScPMuIL_014803 [Solemya velum]
MKRPYKKDCRLKQFLFSSACVESEINSPSAVSRIRTLQYKKVTVIPRQTMVVFHEFASVTWQRIYC